jgi:hypothetical protein
MARMQCEENHNANLARPGQAKSLYLCNGWIEMFFVFVSDRITFVIPIGRMEINPSIQVGPLSRLTSHPHPHCIRIPIKAHPARKKNKKNQAATPVTKAQKDNTTQQHKKTRMRNNGAIKSVKKKKKKGKKKEKKRKKKKGRR